MKLVKINEEHYVVVDDSEIQEGNWCLDFDNKRIYQSKTDEHKGIFKKITYSTEPVDNVNGFPAFIVGGVQELSLQEVKELISELDVEKKAKDEYKDNLHNPFFTAAPMGYIKGYNQALEDNKEKKYTEEDMLNAAKYGYEFRDTTSFPEHKFEDSCINNTKQWLQWYSEPKTEWEVELETIDNRQPCHCQCHNNIDMVHFVACCNDGWIGTVTQKLKLK